MIWSDTTFHTRGASVFAPYHPTQIRRFPDGSPCKSHGQSSAGYDIACSDRWRLPALHLAGTHVIDLTDPQSVEQAFLRTNGEAIVLDPHGVCFVESAEYITMPPDALALAIGKSTDARRGIQVYITPLEPGWEGYLVIEIFNASPFRQVLRANEGIAQLLFYDIDTPPAVTYAQRPNVYQGQHGVASARLV